MLTLFSRMPLQRAVPLALALSFAAVACGERRDPTSPMLPVGHLVPGPGSPPGVTPFTVEAIPYNSTYRVKVYELPAVPPPDYGSVTFDEAGFSTGSAAFGSPATNRLCSPPTPINTAWPVLSQIVLRKHFDLPAAASQLRVMVSVDNDVEVYLNGVTLGARIHDFCPVIDEFRFDAPDVILKRRDNVLAVRGIDRGVETFLDLRVLFECPAGDDDDNDGLTNENELLLGLLVNTADSDGDGIVDGNDDANGNGEDDEDEDDDDGCPDRDSDGDGTDDEDEDDD